MKHMNDLKRRQHVHLKSQKQNKNNNKNNKPKPKCKKEKISWAHGNQQILGHVDYLTRASNTVNLILHHKSLTGWTKRHANAHRLKVNISLICFGEVIVWFEKKADTLFYPLSPWNLYKINGVKCTDWLLVLNLLAMPFCLYFQGQSKFPLSPR